MRCLKYPYQFDTIGCDEKTIAFTGNREEESLDDMEREKQIYRRPGNEHDDIMKYPLHLRRWDLLPIDEGTTLFGIISPPRTTRLYPNI